MGLSALTILMTILEFSTVILFGIGGLYYVKLKKHSGEGDSVGLALTGVISCFIGGLPNACDKACWTFFSYDSWFNSTWMFFFVGIGYICLFLSAIDKKGMKGKMLVLVPGFHKPMKYCSQLAAAIGMTGFYFTMCSKTKKWIGKKAYLYLVTFFTTVFLIVFSVVGKFSSPLPNIIAQCFNSIGYIAFIVANKEVIKKL